MKLLLDPNYSGGSDTGTTSSSVQSTPSKYAKLRRVSEQPREANAGSTGSKTNRSISLGEDCNEKQLSILNSASERNNKKSELKRGRVVDKHHPPNSKQRQGHELDSKMIEDDKENSEAKRDLVHNVKLRQHRSRLRRRHTVGGTKDFADIDLAIQPESESKQTAEAPEDRKPAADYLEDLEDFHHPALSQYHASVMMNVDRSLGQWIRRQQKMGKSSPDLSIIGRRLSLPDSVLATSAAFYPFTSLLESQV